MLAVKDIRVHNIISIYECVRLPVLLNIRMYMRLCPCVYDRMCVYNSKCTHVCICYGECE